MIYSKGVMETVLEDSDIYYYMPREIPRDLDEAGRRITEVFGVKERPFHYEFFRLEDGGLVALEVNMRPPGGLTVDMFNYAGDLDFYKMWAEMVVKGETHVPPPPVRTTALMWVASTTNTTSGPTKQCCTSLAP